MSCFRHGNCQLVINCLNLWGLYDLIIATSLPLSKCVAKCQLAYVQTQSQIERESSFCFKCTSAHLCCINTCTPNCQHARMSCARVFYSITVVVSCAYCAPCVLGIYERWGSLLMWWMVVLCGRAHNCPVWTPVTECWAWAFTYVQINVRRETLVITTISLLKFNDRKSKTFLHAIVVLVIVLTHAQSWLLITLLRPAWHDVMSWLSQHTRLTEWTNSLWYKCNKQCMCITTLVLYISFV